jgi:hypothetical protein
VKSAEFDGAPLTIGLETRAAVGDNGRLVISGVFVADD